ncbi:hypothetical protein [Pseudomonas saliphila]|uniref:hypothetical protein n=1 Tax=Pseudomonas saliphila TaxID=2586906 RepID=UPI00123ACFEB|nr:hypothetical protein [Pseudomonas saliphila]
MSKDEALWVVIRGGGVVFLVLTVVSLTSVVGMGTYWLHLGDIVDAASSVPDGKMMAETTAKTLVSKSIGEFILYGISAFYFMRRGNLVHRFISR